MLCTLMMMQSIGMLKPDKHLAGYVKMSAKNRVCHDGSFNILLTKAPHRNSSSPVSKEKQF